MKRILISVSNDLFTDQRVQKISNTLIKNGFQVLVIGRRKGQTLNNKFLFKTHRFKLFFNKGFLFYFEFNICLFFKLLFEKKDFLYANDLDTLLPNYLVHKLTKTQLIYDSHELFTEVPELINRPFIQKIWLKIESFILPKLKNSITVNSSISEYYNSKYNSCFKVIRNVPILNLDFKKGKFNF